MWKHVAGFAGGFSVVFAMLMLAQRLSGYENKDVAVLIFRAAIVLSAVLVVAAVWDVARWTRKRKETALPDKRPKVVPDRYGVSLEHDTLAGLHLVNHGEVAFDVEVEPLRLADNWTVRFDGLQRLNGNGGFMLATFHHDGTQSTSSLDYLWKRTWEREWESKVLPLTITYRDFDGQRYQSLCEIYRDISRYPEFAVRFVRQRLL